MKPVSLRIFGSVVTCLFAVFFFSGCVAPQGPAMEKQLLHQSILRGDSEGAVKIINSGVLDGNIDGETDFMTALYLAAEKNDTNVVQALLAKGANPNLANSSSDYPHAGETPVHGAARKRSAEALKLLLAHGGNALVRQHVYGMFSNNKTPFDMSVEEIEPPGPVTDILIEAGAEPAKQLKGAAWYQLSYIAGTHWAVASYKERHGSPDVAIQHYELAAQWYESASKKVLGSEKWVKFMNSPVMSAMAASTAVALGGGGPLTPFGPSPLTPLEPETIQSQKTYAAMLHDSGERYAAYSKLCADRAAELRKVQTSNTPPAAAK